MELRRKLEILADAAKYDDASCASGGSRRSATAGGVGSTEGMGICHTYTPDGRYVSLCDAGSSRGARPCGLVRGSIDGVTVAWVARIGLPFASVLQSGLAASRAVQRRLTG